MGCQHALPNRSPPAISWGEVEPSVPDELQFLLGFCPSPWVSFSFLTQGTYFLVHQHLFWTLVQSYWNPHVFQIGRSNGFHPRSLPNQNRSLTNFRADPPNHNPFPKNRWCWFFPDMGPKLTPFQGCFPTLQCFPCPIPSRIGRRLWTPLRWNLFLTPWSLPSAPGPPLHCLVGKGIWSPDPRTGSWSFPCKEESPGGLPVTRLKFRRWEVVELERALKEVYLHGHQVPGCREQTIPCWKGSIYLKQDKGTSVMIFDNSVSVHCQINQE